MLCPDFSVIVLIMSDQNERHTRKIRHSVSSFLRDRRRDTGDICEDTEDAILNVLEATIMGKRINRPRGHKFNVSSKEARTAGGITFDSKWEMQVFNSLKAQIPEGHIHHQPRFLLLDKFYGPDKHLHRAIHYVGDFLLGPARHGDSDPLVEAHMVIDCKGMETEVFKLKMKLFTHRYQALIHRPRTGQLSKVQDLIDSYMRSIRG